jgi:beta-galactosidase
VRWVRAPGPLREAAGFSYQEFSNLEKPLALKGDPLGAGADNEVSYWAEFLNLEHAKGVAYYDHPFFGKWPAITENQFGEGTLTYEGTYLSDALQAKVLAGALREAGIAPAEPSLPKNVRLRSGVNSAGKSIHYYFNYSSDPHKVRYEFADGTELVSNKAARNGEELTLEAWDLAIVEEAR